MEKETVQLDFEKWVGLFQPSFKTMLLKKYLW